MGRGFALALARKHEVTVAPGTQSSSTAEEIKKRLPRARVFKGWNHVHARVRLGPLKVLSRA
jgi:hypothetical protein